MRAKLLYSAAAAFGLLLLGCETGGVGDPCVPEDEYVDTFSGYQDTEVNVESRSFQCETRVCLVNHFRGRVSCPYGQTQATADANRAAGNVSTSPEACRIPGTTGDKPGDAIVVPVPAQFFGRTAKSSPARTAKGSVEDAVYCSCRCANAQGSTDDGARYCECPDGFTCARLIDDLGLGSEQLAGSYCIREGTDWSIYEDRGEDCKISACNCGKRDDGTCGNR